MTETTYIQIALGIISALILFLYAIDSLSSEIQKLASGKFINIIGKFSKNRILATIVGALSTALIQSSSAVSVIAIVLVNSGIISYKNSLGIIFGTNIGTTITAQLALINSSIIAPILIVFSALLRITNKKYRFVSKPIFFLGFILLTLNLVSSAISPIKEDPTIIHLFSYLSSPLLAYIISALFTMIVHSSSITSGIIVILAAQGLLPLDVGIPMILGANLGSSTTSLIASINLNLHARRAGVANVLFNLIGTTLFMILLNPFIAIVSNLANTVPTQTALAHLLFNVINTLIFIIFITPFEKLIVSLIKGNDEEILFSTRYINGGRPPVAVQIENIKKELGYSIETTVKLFEESMRIYYSPEKKHIMNTEKLETLIDHLDDEITKAIVKVTNKKLSPIDATSSVNLVRVSNTIEQLADLGQDLADIFQKMHEREFDTKDVSIESLNLLHSKTISLMKLNGSLIVDPNKKGFKEAITLENEIVTIIEEKYADHVQRLQKDPKYNGNILIDNISIFELSFAKLREIRMLIEEL